MLSPAGRLENEDSLLLLGLLVLLGGLLELLLRLRELLNGGLELLLRLLELLRGLLVFLLLLLLLGLGREGLVSDDGLGRCGLQRWERLRGGLGGMDEAGKDFRGRLLRLRLGLLPCKGSRGGFFSALLHTDHEQHTLFSPNRWKEQKNNRQE